MFPWLPFALGPGLDHLLGIGIAGLAQLQHVVKGIENQQGVAEGAGCCRCNLTPGIPQQIQQNLDVVAPQHGAQELHRPQGSDQRGFNLLLGHSGQKARFHIGGFTDPRRDALC